MVFALPLIALMMTVIQQDDAKRTPKPESEIIAALEDYVESVAEKDGFSGSVAVSDGGKPLLRIGYGLANVEHDVANTPQTKFRIGSITKAFTAITTLILVEQGKLELDDPVSKHYPEAPDAWSKVTIRNLLNHTSGIPSFTSLASYQPGMTKPLSHTEMISQFRDLPLEFEPGSKFNYSNSGYYVLGYVLELVSGKSYEDLLQELICKPLEMANTGYDLALPILPHRAAGYDRDGNQIKNAAYLDMSQPFAAGALYSTVDDLAKFAQGLTAGKLLSNESFETLYRPVLNDYACGWVIQERDGHKLIWHNGGINGFQSMLLRFPDDDLCVVVLANVIPAKVEEIAFDLAKLARGEELEKKQERKVAEIDLKILDDYVGNYRLSEDFVIAVTRDDDRLFAQATGQPKAELFPESETDFFLKVVDAQVTFVRNEAGKVTHLVLHQGGVDQKAEWVD
jgi:CubicO group peptidase (beta-lactamase class C family)